MLKARTTSSGSERRLPSCALLALSRIASEGGQEKSVVLMEGMQHGKPQRNAYVERFDRTGCVDQIEARLDEGIEQRKRLTCGGYLYGCYSARKRRARARVQIAPTGRRAGKSIKALLTRCRVRRSPVVTGKDRLQYEPGQRSRRVREVSTCIGNARNGLKGDYAEHGGVD